MYKRYLSLCIMLLLCTQIAGCSYSDSREEAVSDVQPEAEEPVEEPAEEGAVESGGQKVYTSFLQDIFAVPIRNLSKNIYFHEDKLYLDVWERHEGKVYGDPVEGNVRMVFAEEGEEIVLLDLTELSPTWDRKTVGTTHYLVSGDESRQVLWIYDLRNENVEELRVGENQEIWSWDAKNGKIFYSVRTQNTEEDISNEIMIRDLDSKKEEAVTFDRRIERIQELSVNDKEEIGIYYWDIDAQEYCLGLIQDGQFTEIDTSNVEIWNLGRNQMYTFQLLDDKFMMCTEDIGHTLTPWNRSWELFFDGSFKDIPCETCEEGVLGYVDGFYYVEDYYLIYWSPWTMSGGFAADTVQNAKVRLYTMEGEYCCEMEIPDSNSLQTSVCFVCSDETVYVLSVNGKDYTMCMQEIPLDSDSEPKDKCESVFSDSEKISKENWFVYGSKFYVKTGEDVYEKSDFPEAVQAVLQEDENKDRWLKKEENRLVIESKYHYFYIYDFETNHMEEYRTEYGHLGWKVYRDMLYFIEITGDEKKRLMAYDMASGNAEQIDTGEYEPAQFDIRSDGAIGMWGSRGEEYRDEYREEMGRWKGEIYYCFWEDGTAVYVADKDDIEGNFGWTVLRGFTKNGIILEREYDDYWSLGTKTYVISKDGTIDILESISGSISDRENPKVLPEGSLIYEDDRIVAIDMTSGLVKTYDYDLSCTGELQWDIEVSEDMEFVDYNVEGDGIWGIWKLADKDVYKRAALM